MHLELERTSSRPTWLLTVIRYVSVSAAALVIFVFINAYQNPTSDATEPLTVQLPANTKCTGGTSKNLCLASFTTTAGFGNCVVVSQGSGPANGSSSPAQSNRVRTGAAKGMRRAPAADQKDGSSHDKQAKAEGKKDDNSKDKKVSAKDDVKVKGQKQGQRDAAQSAKDDKQKKGDDKKNGNKKDKKVSAAKDDVKVKGQKQGQRDVAQSAKEDKQKKAEGKKKDSKDKKVSAAKDDVKVKGQKQGQVDAAQSAKDDKQKKSDGKKHNSQNNKTGAKGSSKPVKKPARRFTPKRECKFRLVWPRCMRTIR